MSENPTAPTFEELRREADVARRLVVDAVDRAAATRGVSYDRGYRVPGEVTIDRDEWLAALQALRRCRQAERALAQRMGWHPDISQRKFRRDVMADVSRAREAREASHA